MLKRIYLYCLTATLMLSYYSCSEKETTKIPNSDTESSINENDPVIQRILKAGFKKEEIVAFKDYYMVQGDIMFDKKDTVSRGVHTEQGMSDYLVVYGMRTINVYLAGGFSSINLDGPLNDVIRAYNDIGSELKFVRVYSQAQAHISIVRNDGLEPNVCGAAGFPSPAGKPYGTVNISESTLTGNNLANALQLTQLLAHEMGHCIGLRHTNYLALFEPTPRPIPNSPTSDPFSVMNGNSCGKEWFGFPFFDQMAVQFMYAPTNTSIPSILSPGQTLTQGQFIRSSDYRFTLVMQTDGNLALYHFNQPIWGSGTHGDPSINRCVMQTDGNLVLYDANNVGRWSTGTHRYPGGSLTLQPDGNLVIYQNGVSRWSSNTCCR
ncbi:M57 family metalloprotease [Chitinophaga tropicalis]|uniref:Bulb-type lectin domain-containing protein n=1 Tax=Chitinophaga tropicalis TaxID=2683588 RepID=A0A7K1U5U6_9BACT|nr:M57 family metalloprotease [Chitinophaga tropicalis]MVT09720.1 hypothetical protein [Chitinophaga tropicalis]